MWRFAACLSFLFAVSFFSLDLGCAFCFHLQYADNFFYSVCSVSLLVCTCRSAFDFFIGGAGLILVVVYLI